MKRARKIFFILLTAILVAGVCLVWAKKDARAQDNKITISGTLGYASLTDAKTNDKNKAVNIPGSTISQSGNILVYDFGSKDIIIENTRLIGAVEIKANNISISGLLDARGEDGKNGGDGKRESRLGVDIGRPGTGGAGGGGGYGGGGGGSGRGYAIGEDVTADGGAGGIGIAADADGEPGQKIPTKDLNEGGFGGKGKGPRIKGVGEHAGISQFPAGATDNTFFGSSGDGGTGATYDACCALGSDDWSGGSGGGGGGGGMYLHLTAQENITFEQNGAINTSGGKGGNGGAPSDPKRSAYGQGGKGGGGGSIIVETSSSSGKILQKGSESVLLSNGGDRGDGNDALGGQAGLIRIISASASNLIRENNNGQESDRFIDFDPSIVKIIESSYAKISDNNEFPVKPVFVNSEVTYTLPYNFSTDSRISPGTFPKIQVSIPDGVAVTNAPGWTVSNKIYIYSATSLISNSPTLKIKPLANYQGEAYSNGGQILKISAQFFNSSNQLLYEAYDQSLLISRDLISDLYSKVGIASLDAFSSIAGVAGSAANLKKPSNQTIGDALSSYNLPVDFDLNSIATRINRLEKEFAQPVIQLPVGLDISGTNLSQVTGSGNTGDTYISQGSLAINKFTSQSGKPSAFIAKGNITINAGLKDIKGIFYATGKFIWKPNHYEGSFKGVIIAKGDIELGAGVTKIEWDPAILSNPPPGFGGLFIPVWQE